MAIKTSTGLRNQLLDTSSLKTILTGGFINIYSGTPPVTADDAVSSTNLLVTISVNNTGTGLSFDTSAVNGALAKNPAEVWSGTITATGTASYYRFVGATDTGVASTTEPRIQGTVGTAVADLNLASVSLTVGVLQTIDFFTIVIPSF